MENRNFKKIPLVIPPGQAKLERMTFIHAILSVKSPESPFNKEGRAQLGGIYSVHCTNLLTSGLGVHIQGITGQFVRSAGQSTKLMVPGSVQRLTTFNNGIPATVSLKFTQRSS